MPERRNEDRPEGSDRRDFPRPPLWLNLLLLILAIALGVGARMHRERLDTRYETLFAATTNSPVELAKMRNELAGMNLTSEALKKEIDGRLSYLESNKSKDFYISINTNEKRFRLHYGADIVRDAPVEIGPAASFKEPAGKEWKFVPVKGAFTVEAKEEGFSWQIPAWVHLMNRTPIPAERAVIKNGLGTYVIFLPNDYVIHTPPSPDSPLKGVRPGSFMVPEADLRAVWPRISNTTRVYIF